VSGHNEVGCPGVGFGFGQASEKLKADGPEGEAGVKGANDGLNSVKGPGLPEEVIGAVGIALVNVVTTGRAAVYDDWDGSVTM
jgi:hypothetical protein